MSEYETMDEDFQEASLSFVEKRPPEYKAR
jgi:hypothetical protein